MVHSPFAGSILDYLDAVIRVLELGFHPHAHGRIKRAPIGGSRIESWSFWRSALALSHCLLRACETSAHSAARSHSRSISRKAVFTSRAIALSARRRHSAARLRQ